MNSGFLVMVVKTSFIILKKYNFKRKARNLNFYLKNFNFKMLINFFFFFFKRALHRGPCLA